MIRTPLVSTLSLALLLAGCNAANVQPGVAAPTPTAPAGQEQATPAAGASNGDSAAPAAPTAISNQLDQLNGRLTLLQEQVIQLKSLQQQQSELGQMMLTRLQLLTQSGMQAQASADAPAPADTGAGERIDAAIDQLLQVLNQMGMSDSGDDPYAVATTYTGKGAWILVRYRTDTGETWLADGGSWLPLEEEVSLSPSSYRVQLSRADQDLKGYVAVRIDQQSGQTWWLNDRRWQVYE